MLLPGYDDSTSSLEGFWNTRARKRSFMGYNYTYFPVVLAAVASTAAATGRWRVCVSMFLFLYPPLSSLGGYIIHIKKTRPLPLRPR